MLFCKHEVNVGDRVGFIYPTRRGAIGQGSLDRKKGTFGYVERIGVGSKEQRSQGTGGNNVPFVQINVSWGNGSASFDEPKIIPGTFRVERA